MRDSLGDTYVLIIPLTTDLIDTLEHPADKALNGDRKCSLKTMNTSCFASEGCTREHGVFNPVRLSDLMFHPYSYVATTRRNDFVGCVSAVPIHQDRQVANHFPDLSIDDDAIVLYNLCVSQDFRGHGIGRKLVSSILDLSPKKHVYLLVARGSSQLNEVFAERVRRLQDTYNRLGFHTVRECQNCFLFKYEQ